MLFALPQNLNVRNPVLDLTAAWPRYGRCWPRSRRRGPPPTDPCAQGCERTSPNHGGPSAVPAIRFGGRGSVAAGCRRHAIATPMVTRNAARAQKPSRFSPAERDERCMPVPPQPEKNTRPSCGERRPVARTLGMTGGGAKTPPHRWGRNPPSRPSASSRPRSWVRRAFVAMQPISRQVPGNRRLFRSDR